MKNQNSKNEEFNNQNVENLFLGKRQPNASFLSTYLIDGMADLVNNDFDPYGSFNFNYHVCFYSAAYLDTRDLTSTNQHFGSLNFVKKADGTKADYTVSRSITGYLNRKNSAKPESITQYHHTVKNDNYLSTIQPGDILHYDYIVRRKYFNNQFPDIYKHSQDIYIDKNKHILKKANNGDLLIGVYSNLLFTKYSLMDTLQKFTVSEDAKSLVMNFDLLENMEVLKLNHNVRYFDTITLDFNGHAVKLFGYIHTGCDILPTYYWITEKGLLTYVKYGISSIILTN